VNNPGAFFFWWAYESSLLLNPVEMEQYYVSIKKKVWSLLHQYKDELTGLMKKVST